MKNIIIRETDLSPSKRNWSRTPMVVHINIISITESFSDNFFSVKYILVVYTLNKTVQC